MYLRGNRETREWKWNSGYRFGRYGVAMLERNSNSIRVKLGSDTGPGLAAMASVTVEAYAGPGTEAQAPAATTTADLPVVPAQGSGPGCQRPRPVID